MKFKKIDKKFGPAFEVTQFTWDCWPNTSHFDYKLPAGYMHVVADTSGKKQEVYELTAYSMGEGALAYRWINPKFIDPYIVECNIRDERYNIAWDTIEWTDIADINDLLKVIEDTLMDTPEEKAEPTVETVAVETADNGDQFIKFSDELMNAVGWKIGDTIDWADNGDNTWTLKKIVKEETEWVLVETVSTMRHRYMVEVPKGKELWALDTVTMEEATEFSQKSIDENIISHRVVSYEEAIKMCDQDNEYGSTWPEDVKVRNFFTKHKA